MQSKNNVLSINAAKDHTNFHIEIDKKGSGVAFFCSGVRGINEFSKDKIVLSLFSFSVTVEGKELSLTVFEAKAVEIVGKVLEVKFQYGKT